MYVLFFFMQYSLDPLFHPNETISCFPVLPEGNLVLDNPNRLEPVGVCQVRMVE